MSSSPEELLFSFYDLSYPAHLGIPFYGRDIRAAQYKSLSLFLNHEFTSEIARQVLEQLDYYKRVTSPTIKLQPLLNYIKKENLLDLPNNVIDFGCGSGQSLELLFSTFSSIQTAYCIDTDHKILEENKKNLQINSAEVFFLSGIRDIRTRAKDCDLCLTIHTLHHMNLNEQLQALKELIESLRPGGTFYLYEDSWRAHEIYRPSELIDLDKELENMSRQDVMSLFFMNDYWSNEWCYERKFHRDRHLYRSIEEWFDLFSSMGMKIVDKEYLGFDLRRLHGVPSIWLIAQK